MKHKLFEHFAPKLLILLVVLVLILNSALIIGFQTVTAYPHHGPQEPFEQETHYEFLDLCTTDRICGYLLWQNNQQWRLVITERHFHSNHWRTVCDTILMEQDFSEEFSTATGRVIVKVHGYADFVTFNWIPSLTMRTLNVPANFLLWNMLLLILEVTGFFLLRKLRR